MGAWGWAGQGLSPDGFYFLIEIRRLLSDGHRDVEVLEL